MCFQPRLCRYTLHGPPCWRGTTIQCIATCFPCLCYVRPSSAPSNWTHAFSQGHGTSRASLSGPRHTISRSMERNAPFLLLWSKRTLAASLKSVFVYNESTNTLRLKKGISSAPWLHFTTVAASSSNESLPTRGAGRHSLCMKDPWWYCNTCFHYWLSSSRAGEYFHNFEMNTNAYVSWSTLAKQLVPLSWN